MPSPTSGRARSARHGDAEYAAIRDP
jgi:hypothetical protein